MATAAARLVTPTERAANDAADLARECPVLVSALIEEIRKAKIRGQGGEVHSVLRLVADKDGKVRVAGARILPPWRELRES